MQQDAKEHEVVRFRRDEIAALDRYPSAAVPIHRLCRRRFWGRALIRCVLVALAAFLVACCIFYLVGVDAIGNERLRRQAAQEIERLAGFEVDVVLGEIRLAPGAFSLFALEVANVEIARASDGKAIATAGELSFGLRAFPLLKGRVELARVAMAEAAFSPSHMPSGGQLAAFLSGEEVVRPDALQTAVFGAIHRAFSMTERAALTRVTLTEISMLPEDGGDPDLVIQQLDLWRSDEKQIAFEGTANLHGHAFGFNGHAIRSVETETVDHLSFTLFASDARPSGAKPSVGLLRALDDFEVVLSGREAIAGEGGHLNLDMQVRGAVVGLGREEILVDSALMRIASQPHDTAFSVPGLSFSVGRTRINLEGRIEPVTENSESGGTYRLEMVSRQSHLAPKDSPEPALPFAMRMNGRFEAATKRLIAELIDMRTAEGSLTASAALTIPAGMSPGVTLALYVADLPTAHAKQFWPWFAAPGARRWTLENVFGGRVRDSNLRLSVPPGRLGNGVPLSADEVYGRFNLASTRFDIAGHIPPVRDGRGSVDFSGTDVNVELESGSIYLPSGRSVDASDGTLTIRAAHIRPRIGKLSIDVSGEAPAIVELASFEPINASTLHNLHPDDVQGTVSGHINADIPLQKEIPSENLRWDVNLFYEQLSISKPFQGQEVTNAKGELLVRTDRAEISAEADLNGVPARLRLVEPLRNSSVERVRHIELQMNDAARDKLFPGLGLLVSGPFTVIYDETPDQETRVEVQLDRATLTVPWIGWRKGPGIAAAAAFRMERADDNVELSDFVLRGESFLVSGDVQLSSGALEAARFDQVRFNRGDDYSATIRREGGTYAVSVQGSSIDARGIIKQALNDGAASAGAGRGDSDSVHVTARLDRAYGFHGESLGQVELSYARGGNRPDRLSITGAADGYGALILTKEVVGGRHVVRAATENGGAILRFLDLYKHMEGGQISLALEGASNNDLLSGQLDIRDFRLVDEPRMRSLVAATPDSSGRVDSTRVEFERAGATLTIARKALSITNGVLRGPLIGSTFQGTVYDPNGRMDITGTFMPLYSVNRIFGEIPLLGLFLGNGPDKGLIGITYRLAGEFGNPRLEVNPISVIAPGFLRELFEFR